LSLRSLPIGLIIASVATLRIAAAADELALPTLAQHQRLVAVGALLVKRLRRRRLPACGDGVADRPGALALRIGHAAEELAPPAAADGHPTAALRAAYGDALRNLAGRPRKLL